MRQRQKFVVLGLMLLIILLLPKFILPPIIESHLVELIATELGGTTTVEIKSSTGWGLLAGKISEITVHGKNWEINRLPLASFTIYSTNLQIDLEKLLKSGSFDYISSGLLNAQAEITETGINHYFWDEVDPKRYFQLSFTPDGAHLGGAFDFWNTIWDLNLLMDVQIYEQQKIALLPQELTVRDTRVPNILIELISDRYGIVIDLSDLPIPLKIDKIELGNENMILYGSGVQE